MHPTSTSVSDHVPRPADLLAAARGFSAFFWGLLIAAIMLLGALSIEVPFLDRAPVHVVGLVILLNAARLLRKAFPGDGAWQGLVRAYGCIVLVQFYLLPFLGWWRAGTADWYTRLNILILLADSLALLVVAQRLVHLMARRLPASELVQEARLAMWSLPVLALAALGMIVRGNQIASHTNPLSALQQLVVYAHPWFLFPALLPALPFLFILWSIKERCLEGLAQPPGGAPD